MTRLGAVSGLVRTAAARAARFYL